MSEGRAWTQDDVMRLVSMLRDGRTTEEAANALGRQSGDDGKRSVHAPLPRLWRTHDRLSLPCVLGEAAQEGRLQPQ